MKCLCLAYCDNRIDAIEVASKHPAAHLGEQVGWGIEVRPIERFQEWKSS